MSKGWAQVVMYTALFLKGAAELLVYILQQKRFTVLADQAEAFRESATNVFIATTHTLIYHKQKTCRP